MSEPFPVMPDDGAAPTELDGEQPREDSADLDDVVEIDEYVGERAW